MFFEEGEPKIGRFSPRGNFQLAHSFSLSLSHTKTYNHIFHILSVSTLCTHTRTLSNTHTYTQTLYLSLAHTCTSKHTLFFSLFHSHTKSLPHAQIHIQTLSHTFYLTHSLSDTHSPSQTHTRTHRHSHYLSYTNTLSLSLSLSHCSNRMNRYGVRTSFIYVVSFILPMAMPILLRLLCSQLFCIGECLSRCRETHQRRGWEVMKGRIGRAECRQ